MTNSKTIERLLEAIKSEIVNIVLENYKNMPIKHGSVEEIQFNVDKTLDWLYDELEFKSIKVNQNQTLKSILYFTWKDDRDFGH